MQTHQYFWMIHALLSNCLHCDAVMPSGINRRHSCWYTDWLAILRFGWNSTRACTLTSAMFSKFPFSESACTILNTVALDVQHAIQDMEKKLLDRARKLTRAMCMVRGKDEVKKVMAVRAQVCLPPSHLTFLLLCLLCTQSRLPSLMSVCGRVPICRH